MSEQELFGKYYKKAEEYLQRMTLEERIGQMFFVRYSEKAKDVFKKNKVGGFVLYHKDFKKEKEIIKKELEELQKLSMDSIKLPLGLAVDEEGGSVNRVSAHEHLRKEKFPSPQETFKKLGIQGILAIEQEKRDFLREFHININLAPVADISNNEKNFIYKRTLGESVEKTTEYIAKEVEEYVNDNFSCCVKHFPGYGNNIDTHGEIARDNRSYEIFQNVDLKPFESAIENKTPLIMFSHNIVECKDKKYPVSLSKIWHDLLRKELNYSGIIITDDLSMAAVKKWVDEDDLEIILDENDSEIIRTVKAGIIAVKAGNDIILTADYYLALDKLLAEIKDEVESGDISEDLINKACKRIIAWKLKYFLKFQPQE